MFGVDDLKQVLEQPQFCQDYNWVRTSLLQHRFNHELPQRNGEVKRLSHFVEGVLASAPSWEDEDGLNICRIAGEVAELLSITSSLPEEFSHKMRIRSALLYELAEIPSLTSAVLRDEDFSGLLYDMFLRRSSFKNLGFSQGKLDTSSRDNLANLPELEQALSHDSLVLALYEQGFSILPETLASTALVEVAKQIQLPMNASELQAFEAVIKKRLNSATRSNVSDSLFNQLKKVKFPVELWTAQLKALQGGLIDKNYDSWGFAAPTGSGKTFLARLLIIQTLEEKPESKILYIVPTKALVNEVWMSLNQTLSNLDYSVIKITPQLVELDQDENSKLESCSVVVLTPEKADLLLRLGSEFVLNSSLIVVDEAHHIEAGSRGVLLELYLWRIRKLFEKKSRVVFLSAVAPNILDFASWLGSRPGGVVVDHRSTRMRAGVYRIRKNGKRNEGWIDYADGTSILAVSTSIERSEQRQLLQLASVLITAGPVLVVAKGKGTTETLATKMKDYLVELGSSNLLSQKELESAEIRRLDSRLEREMYQTVAMRELLKHKIAYHHAGLPPRVRIAVEDSIRAGFINYVFATTTLAEGVNFPFSSVIVQSLALKGAPEKGKPIRYSPVTPRSFWNIAGRAGRPGYDREGQAILFEPSLGLERINAVIESYLDSSINGVQPVGSALAESLSELAHSLQLGELTLDDVSNVSLPDAISKKARGTINLLRVGIIHAKASNLLPRVEDILDSTFAARYLNENDRNIALMLLQRQLQLVNEFLNEPDAPSQEMIAELGLSLETIVELRNYVRDLDDWKLEDFSNLMFGGKINVKKAPYIIGPVARLMAELEGPKLGGLYSSVALNWLEGIPLTILQSRSGLNNTLEELISVIYSRIQYLLPWGLYAMHELVQEECRRRNIVNYNDEILSLAYLVDAGVPNFDALRLVNLEFERVDATRIAKVYLQLRSRDTDIVGWLTNQTKLTIFDIVKGSDNRRLDYDLDSLLDRIKDNT